MIRIRLFLLAFIASLLFLSAAAQTRKITGEVLSSDDGSPLPGVSIRLKGSNTGVISQSDGKFSMNVPSGAVLIFSYLGYEEKEVAVENSSNLVVRLDSRGNTLEQVVVVGYGTQKKKDVTGAITSVNAEDVRSMPVTNTQQALQGRAAGVDVVNGSRSPGAEPQVRIRGSRSFSAGNSPLYVVDGIPLVNSIDLGNGAVSAGGISDLNPADIASIEVLKDASATAIYGSRGANGVIIVTTRRGQAGKPTVNYNGYFGVSTALGQVDLMNGPQFAEYKRESRRATGKYPAGVNPEADKTLFEPVELQSIASGRTTDYQALLLKPGHQTNHEVGVSGGNEMTKYLVSLGVFKEEGIIPTQDYLRSNLRVNLDQNIGRSVKVGVSTLLSNSIRNGQNLNPLDGALQENPLGVPYDENGKMIFLPTTDGLRTNPLAEIVPGAMVDRRRRTRLFGSLYGELNIAEGLKYRLNFGPDITQENAGYFQGSQTNIRRGGTPRAGENNIYTFAYTLENVLTYSKTLGVHALNLTGLYSIQNQRSESSGADVEGIPVESQSFYNLGGGNIIRGVNSRLSEYAIASYMARLNYVLKGKYLLTLTGRADGSSRFAEGNKWSYFPSLALGWNMTEESFVKGIRSLSNLKLRFSYGITGNTEIEPYLTQGGLARTTYAFGNTGAFGFYPNELPNPDLKWETTASTNIGLDIGLWNDRITGSVDFYRQKTSDLLLRKFLPISNGFASILQNVGSTQNKGVEMQLSTVNIAATGNKGFSWSTDFTFNINRQKVLSLFSGQKDDVGNGWFIGQPIQVYYDYRKIGIWQSNEAELAKAFKQNPGEIRVEDVSGPEGRPDGKIDASDRVILGSNQPKWTGGITNKFEYRGFDLSVFAYIRQGGMIRSRFHDSYNSLFGRYNNLNVNYWTPTNPSNDYPRPNQNQESPIYSSSLSYFDGSFIKIRNVALGYNLPVKIADKIKASSVRLYLSAQQPWIFAPYRQKYKGIDPENITQISSGTPSNRVILFGINAGF